MRKIINLVHRASVCFIDIKRCKSASDDASCRAQPNYVDDKLGHEVQDLPHEQFALDFTPHLFVIKGQLVGEVLVNNKETKTSCHDHGDSLTEKDGGDEPSWKNRGQ